MAVLPDLDRERVWRWLLRHLLGSCAFTKSELRAAVNAADDWADTNAAAYNLALPLAFRTNATATQKALLLAAVVMRRHGGGLLRVPEDG